MAQQLADVHERGAVLQKMGGVGVAEGVRGGLDALGQEGVDAPVDEGREGGASQPPPGGGE